MLKYPRAKSNFITLACKRCKLFSRAPRLKQIYRVAQAVPGERLSNLTSRLTFNYLTQENAPKQEISPNISRNLCVFAQVLAGCGVPYTFLRVIKRISCTTFHAQGTSICAHTNDAVLAFQKCAISRGNLVSVTRQRAKVKTRLSRIGTQSG